MIRNDLFRCNIGDLARLSKVALKLGKVLPIGADSVLGELSFVNAVSKKRRDGSGNRHMVSLLGLGASTIPSAPCKSPFSRFASLAGRPARPGRFRRVSIYGGDRAPYH